MKYILDFDGVIFDIEALREKMERLRIPTFPRSSDILNLIREKDPDLKFSDLLFPDARKFLEIHGKDCIILSTHISSTNFESQNETDSFNFQYEKILASGVKELGVEDIRVVGKEKTEELKKLYDQYGEDCIYVDDREKYVIESMEVGIRAFFMNRKKFGPFKFMRTFERPTELFSLDDLEGKLK